MTPTPRLGSAEPLRNALYVNIYSITERPRLVIAVALAIIAALAAVLFFFGAPKGSADGHADVAQSAVASINVVPSAGGVREEGLLLIWTLKNSSIR